MSEYKKHVIDQIDSTILDRIMDEDVAAWMVAKMHQLRTTGLQVSTLCFNVGYCNFCREESYDTHITAHAAGECDYGPSLEVVLGKLRRSIAGNPRQKADEKKRKAARLLAQAAELDAVADSLK